MRAANPSTRLCLLLVAAAAGGCTAKGRWSETDALREQLADAERRITTLTAERDEARAIIAEADRVRLGTGELSAEAAAALPRVATLTIDPLSGLTDANPDDSTPFDAVEVYLKPADGRGRFVQIVGSVSVRADLLPRTGMSNDASPRTLASATFGPAELREAYRSTFLSTHYTLRMPLPDTRDLAANNLAISVEFLDALSGRVHRAERVLTVARPILSR
ncbi:MAG: hypothetical protein JNK58_07255 [Phycisphaerae bacterium]|nr:hypothetical protein [Phycisphaerae bacterium]